MLGQEGPGARPRATPGAAECTGLINTQPTEFIGQFLPHAPPQVVRELLSAHERREFLSFAAAQMLELGLPERLALLLSRDTGARLQYVMAAVEPHLQRLQAQAAVKRALGSYDGGQ